MRCYFLKKEILSSCNKQNGTLYFQVWEAVDGPLNFCFWKDRSILYIFEQGFFLQQALNDSVRFCLFFFLFNFIWNNFFLHFSFYITDIEYWCFIYYQWYLIEVENDVWKLQWNLFGENRRCWGWVSFFWKFN